MRWLSAQLDAAGVTQQQRHLSSLAELAGEGWDVVINCCGLGSRDLLPDPHCYPIRGQIMRVRAPWVNQCVFAEFPDETSYIIPNRYAFTEQSCAVTSQC
jgi:glycine/D-amino acid oxidase-like deaminating enzyme